MAMENEPPFLQKSASDHRPKIPKINVKKSQLKKLENLLVAIDGVESNLQIDGYVSAIHKHYLCSIQVYRLFLNSICSATKFALHETNNFHANDNQSVFKLRPQALFRHLTEMMALLTKTDSNGNICIKKMSAFNPVVEELFQRLKGGELLQLPFVQNQRFSLIKCLNSGFNHETQRVLNDYLNKVFAVVRDVYSVNCDRIHNQKILSLSHEEKQWQYIKTLFQRHERLYLLRALVKVRLTNPDHLMEVNKQLLDNSADFFRTYKKMPYGECIHGFLWRLEPAYLDDVGLQLVLFCNFAAMDMDPYAIKLAVINHWFKRIDPQALEIERPEALLRPIRMNAEGFEYSFEFLQQSKLSELKKMNQNALIKRDPKAPASPVHLFGNMTLKSNPEASKSLRALSQYFVLTQEFFPLQGVFTQELVRPTRGDASNPQIYKKKQKIHGRGQFHSKKPRKKTKDYPLCIMKNKGDL
ncbi:MAG: hypothetical protein CO158_02095 [Piscirickettsiaceae bacterium CG_4_9_14_3_um_filter_43_564]|nr:MAG: hypothetical protein COW74_02075 [Piscirickettsiaceae bacterium CG18_big_fil_WC_8_21_14_2_50_44_103]PIU38734.1 MAG: hypothetical protein COT01_05195 [Piscirickettsiaceae bacterium CG07_land_8_20_14_0_80_44_28]PJA66656.1 MAG: hypothetical protein CO158_02095 [Piscirickettsiaceae bacterium CG_4_9_14_3_um_filter_43_564]